MEDISRNSKPLWLQLLLLSGWLGLFIWLNTFGDPQAAEASVQELSPGLIRILAIIDDILVFIIPVLLFVFLLRKEKFSFLNLGKRIHPLWIVAALFAIFFSIPLISWLGEMNSQVKLPAALKEVEDWMLVRENLGARRTEQLLSDRTMAGVVANLLVMGLIAAISEELFFRGVIQRTLMETKLSPHLAIWITAIIFSGIHMQFYGFFPRAALGAIIGYLYFFTGSLWISIFAHFINNALYVGMAYATADVKVNPLEQPAEEGMHWSMILLSVLLVTGVFIFLKRMSTRGDEIT